MAVSKTLNSEERLVLKLGLNSTEKEFVVSADL